MHYLRIDGRAARLVKNDAQSYAQQQVRGRVGGGEADGWGLWLLYKRAAQRGSTGVVLVEHSAQYSLCPTDACAHASVPCCPAGLQNEGLVPWGAQPDVLIDRYDVRSLLDIYVPPDPRWVTTHTLVGFGPSQLGC